MCGETERAGRIVRPGEVSGGPHQCLQMPNVGSKESRGILLSGAL